MEHLTKGADPPGGKLLIIREKLDLEPSHAWEWTLLGVELYDQGNLDDAVAAYRRSLDLDPDDANTWYNLGVAMKDKADHAIRECIDACQKAVAIDPGDDNAWMQLGVALQGSGDTIGAIEAFRKAVTIDPGDANAWYQLGVALHGKGDHGGATGAYKKALAVDPAHGRAKHNLKLATRHDLVDDDGQDIAVKDHGVRAFERRMHKLEAKQDDSTGDGLVYLRVLELEKAARGNKVYPINELCKMLKDIDPMTVTRFIKMFDNEFLIEYDVDKNHVIIHDPSLPELEIIGREFEKWLRFGRL